MERHAREKYPMYVRGNCFTLEELRLMQADEIEWAMLHAEGCSACNQILQTEDEPYVRSDPNAEA